MNSNPSSHSARKAALVVLSTLLATLMLLTPGASALETQAVQTDEADADQAERKRPLRPRIRCHGAVSMAGDPMVKCRWTESAHPAAAAYKVVRVGGGDRSVVYRGDTSTTRFVDETVEFNTRYRYRVVVVNENGRRIQRSRWNKAFVRGGDTERLHLDCNAAEVDAVPETDAVDPELTTKPVICSWEAAESEGVTEYQLWRRLRGEHRELVATVGADVLSQGDDVPADTGRGVYAVLALDADGEIIGRSGLSKVTFPTDG